MLANIVDSVAVLSEINNPFFSHNLRLLLSS